jgi:hypothetical protein
MPYVKLSIKKRVYLEDDLMEWFKGKRTKADVTQKEMTQKVDHPSLLPKGEKLTAGEDFPDRD